MLKLEQKELSSVEESVEVEVEYENEEEYDLSVYDDMSARSGDVSYDDYKENYPYSNKLLNNYFEKKATC